MFAFFLELLFIHFICFLCTTFSGTHVHTMRTGSYTLAWKQSGLTKQNKNGENRSWRFCRKTCFEASRVVFWSLSCYKELKLTTNLFTGCTLHSLLIQMQNISLRSSGMHRKQTFKIVFRFKSDTAVLTFTFHFLSPLFLLFLPLLFFLLLGI